MDLKNSAVINIKISINLSAGLIAAKHILLIYVGAWSLIESLASSMGKQRGKSFKDFFSGGNSGKLAKLGLHSGQNAIHKAEGWECEMNIQSSVNILLALQAGDTHAL